MMFGISALRSLVHHFTFDIMLRVGVKAQAALAGAVYRKVSNFTSIEPKQLVVLLFLF